MNRKSGYFGQQWDSVFDHITDDTVITALYQVNQYTIDFDSAGGSSVVSITQDYGTDVFAPEDPTREGYSFAGWSPVFPVTMPAFDTTLTAQWIINQYTLTYNAGPNSSIIGVAFQTVEYGGSGSPVEAVPNAPFSFVKWSDGSTENPRTDTNVTGDIAVDSLCYIPGDMDNNHTVGLGDAILALQSISGVPVSYFVLADADGDAKISLPDVIYILQKVSEQR